MKKSMNNLFKATALVVLMGFSISSYAQIQDGIAAVVNDDVILQSDLNQGIAAVMQKMQAQNKALPSEYHLKQQVLEQLILRQVQKNLVKRYGIRVSDEELNQVMQKYAQQSGVKTLEELQQRLDSQAPHTYASLRASLAEDLAIQHLSQQIVSARIKISDQDVDNFLKSPAGQASIGSQYHVLHMRISGMHAKDVAEQAKLQLEQNNQLQSIAQKLSKNNTQIQAQDLGWKELSEIPVELAVRVSSLKPGQVSEQIKGDDGSIHLVKVVDHRMSDEKLIVPQYQTQHILIQPTIIVSQDDAKHMIDMLYQRVMKGEDFSTLAATFSTDTGSARDSGNLGWVNLGTMVPEFEEVMRNTPVGEVSQPFQTQYGWHILKVTGIRQYDMTEEKQRQLARQILGESRYEAELENWLREIRSSAYVKIMDESLK